MSAHDFCTCWQCQSAGQLADIQQNYADQWQAYQRLVGHQYEAAAAVLEERWDREDD